VTIRDLLATYGKTVALRVAVELGCGGADKQRVLQAAEAAHAHFVGALSPESRAALEQEL
jgi:hypothetical protein